MKLKIIILLLLSSFFATAQTTSSDERATPWDWRSQFWEIHVTSNVNNISGDFPSPFNSTDNLNVIDLAQADDPITGIPKNDWNPEDGWVLLRKNLGTPTNATSAPYVILYNKHTAVIRCFFLVVQQFSANNSSTPGGKDANITVTFYPVGPGRYQPNLLVNTAPLQPLDVFIDKNTTVVPNYYRDNIPYWLFADIPVSYDPCTSIADVLGYLTITTSLLQSSNLAFTLLAQPFGQDPIANDKVNTLSDFSTALKGENKGLGVAGTLSGGVKFAKTASDVLDKFSKATEQHSNLVRKTKLRADLAKLSTGLGTASKWASLIPVYGEAASGVLSLIDAFTGGGSDSGAPGGTVILNDFKAQGSITSSVAKSTANFAIPGVPRTGVASQLFTEYNNTLGVFNLLYTPEQTTYKTEFDQVTNINLRCNIANSGYGFSSDVVSRIRQDYVKLNANSLNQVISYVVNPVLDIDLENSDILFSLQTVGRFTNTNMIDEGVISVKNKSNPNQIDEVNIYRTEYYPIKQAKDITVFRETLLSKQLVGYGAVAANLCPGYITPNIYTKFGSVTDEWTIKIVARLKRRGKNKPSDDLVFIGTYPVKLASTVLNANPPSTGNPSTSIVSLGPSNCASCPSLLDQGVYGFYSLTPFTNPVNFYGLNFSNATNNNNLIQAPSITLQPLPNRDLVITPYPGGDVIFEAKNTNYQPPASAASIVAFCNDPKYKTSNRYTLRTVAPEEPTTSPSAQPTQEFKNTLTAFPNPTTGETTIRYEVQKEGSSIEIFVSSMLGERVITLANVPTQGAGVYEVHFDASKLAEGIYIYTLLVNGERISKKLVVSK